MFAEGPDRGIGLDDDSLFRLKLADSDSELDTVLDALAVATHGEAPVRPVVEKIGDDQSDRAMVAVELEGFVSPARLDDLVATGRADGRIEVTQSLFFGSNQYTGL